jgi:hypothetical protein
MPEADTTRVKLRTGASNWSMRGAKVFLRPALPKFFDVIASLKIPGLSGAATTLNETVREFFQTVTSLDELIDSMKADIASMSELSEMASLKLQMDMDPIAKFTQTMSNIPKKISDSSDAIITNLK